MDKKVVKGWAMYDWANSAFALVITSTIFPIYYSGVTGSEDTDVVIFFGRNFVNTSLSAYAISAAFLIIACISPFLSGIADYIGNKKLFMKIFCYLGGCSCIALFFFTKDTLELGIIAFILANVGFAGSIVFYNAYLPEIAPKEEQDNVSAKGFAYGYVGSVILLLICLSLVLFPNTFSLEDDAMAARVSFLLVGAWWMGFAQVTFYRLPKSFTAPKERDTHNYFLKGYKELSGVFKQVKQNALLKYYLAAFFFYSTGVQTVMYLATYFGEKEMNLPKELLIATILVIQFVAIGGAFFFSYLSEKKGNIYALLCILFIWMFICFGAYFITSFTGFIIAATFIGLVMGGIQSLSRSTYSKMLPAKDHASYFSFYDVTEKIAIVVGTACFGLIEEITGSMRNSLLFLILFFIIGAILLFVIKRNKFTEPIPVS